MARAKPVSYFSHNSPESSFIIVGIITDNMPLKAVVYYYLNK